MYYVGAIEVRTPGLVLAEMRTVDVIVSRLTSDIMASEASEKFRRGYLGFVEEWNAFYQEHANGAGAWFARGTTPVYNKVIDYKKRAVAWAEDFRARGGDVTPFQASESGITKLSIWPFVGGAAVALGLVYAVYGKIER